MSIQFGLALLALFSFTAASDPACEELIKPLEDRTKIYGKWIFQAGTTDNEQRLKMLKTATNSWIQITALPGSDEFLLRYGDKIDGKCYYGSSESITTGNATKVTFQYNSTTFSLVGRHLVACPGCAVWTHETVMNENQDVKKSKSLYLFTKTEKVNPSYLEDFKKQAACLNISSEFYFPETTNFCPDEQEAADELAEEQ